MHNIRKRQTPSSNSELKKPNSVPGLEPGLLRQNAVALPHVPPPLPNTVG